MEAKLVMFRENGERREFPLSKKTTIGRSESCQIRIPLAEVSRRHAEVGINGNEVVLKDPGSANGTYVNNERVTSTKLAAGDRVIIGPVVFTLQIDGQPTDLGPVKIKLKKREPPPPLPTDAPTASADSNLSVDDEVDPISAREALASSADQTAIDPFDDEDLQ